VESELCHATVEYFGCVEGQSQIKPIMAKMEAILNFPKPKSKRKLMRFLGMGGYYRKFCPNCSTITSSLANLLRKGVKLSWTESCQFAFDNIMDFSKESKLVIDASDVGVDAVLLQEGKDKIDLPICYFSTNLTP